MKRISIVAVLTCVASLSFAQVSVGAVAGLTYTLEDFKDLEELGLDVLQIGVPLLAEVGYKLPVAFNVPGLGAGALTAGAQAGWLHLASGNLEESESMYGMTVTTKFDFSMTTIPMLFFARAEAGLLYVDLGLGFHSWTAKASGSVEFDGFKETFDESDKGTDFAAYLGAGVKFALSDKLDLRAGGVYYSLGVDGDVEYDTAAIGAVVGVSYKL